MNNEPETLEHLLARLDMLSHYPAGVVRMPAHIVGTAFSPGGLGLWNVQSTGSAHRGA